MISANFEQWWRNAGPKGTAVVVACVLTVGFAALFASPGHLSVDEIVYHLMARDLLASGRWDLLNGYHELPINAFTNGVTVALGDRLVSQYPVLHSIIAAPFYAVAQYRGLIVLNALSFCAVVWLVYAIAQRIFSDRALSLSACLILIFATYSWDYAVAAWPHALTNLFVVAAFYFALRALQAAGGRNASLWALAAGLTVGFGVGVRVDVIFVLPAVMVPLLFAVPARIIPTAAVGLGLLPGLLFLTAINQIRYGIASPLTYGRSLPNSNIDPLSYLPIVALGTLVLAVVWFATRPAGLALIRSNPRRLGLLAVLGAGALLLLPEVQAQLGRFLDGFAQLVIDLRFRDLDILEGGLSRSESGSMIYMGRLKKSLLQSCPYLVVLVVPIYHAIRGRPQAFYLAALLLAPASYIGAFSYFAWHGGLGLNLRYFLAMLPFTSILAAYALTALLRKAAAQWTAAKLAVILRQGFWGGAILAMPAALLPLALGESLILSVSLLLAAVLLSLTLLSLFGRDRIRCHATPGVLIVLMAGFAWSGVLAFTYDVPTAWAKRHGNVTAAREAGTLIGPNALILSQALDYMSPLYDRGDVIIAEPFRDDFTTFRDLVFVFSEKGRPVFGWYSDLAWQELRDLGVLEDIDATTVGIAGALPLRWLRPKADSNGSSDDTASLAGPGTRTR